MKTSILHREIYEVLRNRILRGDYGSAGKLPTELQLTQEFKVSRITVMRALRDLQNDDLIWRKQGSGSFVRDAKENQFRLGIMIPGLLPSAETESIFPAVQRQLVREASKLGWHVLLGNLEMSDQADPSTCAPVEVARRLVAHGAKAVVFTPLQIEGRWNSLNRNVLAELKSAKVAVVLLGRDIVQYPERSEWDLVSMDEMNAGYLVGKHLLTQGSHRIVFVSSNSGRGQFPQLRLMGLRQALDQSSKTLTEVPIWNQDRLKEVHTMILKHRCDGIVCENDTAAAHVMTDLLEAGVTIPEQVRLVSFDNAAVARLLPVPLTSFAQPITGMARAALSTLIGRKREPSLPPRFIQLEGRLAVRKSTRA